MSGRPRLHTNRPCARKVVDATGALRAQVAEAQLNEADLQQLGPPLYAIYKPSPLFGLYGQSRVKCTEECVWEGRFRCRQFKI